MFNLIKRIFNPSKMKRLIQIPHTIKQRVNKPKTIPADQVRVNGKMWRHYEPEWCLRRTWTHTAHYYHFWLVDMTYTSRSSIVWSTWVCKKFMVLEISSWRYRTASKSPKWFLSPRWNCIKLYKFKLELNSSVLVWEKKIRAKWADNLPLHEILEGVHQNIVNLVSGRFHDYFWGSEHGIHLKQRLIKSNLLNKLLQISRGKSH